MWLCPQLTVNRGPGFTEDEEEEVKQLSKDLVKTHNIVEVYDFHDIPTVHNALGQLAVHYQTYEDETDEEHEAEADGERQAEADGEHHAEADGEHEAEAVGEYKADGGHKVVENSEGGWRTQSR
jgi:uncharacterized sporulation protein YeaH/YhbH (DUF444 family)